MRQTKSYVIQDYYNAYCEFTGLEGSYNVPYPVYSKLVREYFKYLRDEVIENGREIRIPAYLGYLSIVKHKPKYYNDRSLRCDYRESEKYGKKILYLNEHTNGFKYRFYWNKHTMKVRNKTKYRLVMTRENKRRLAYILKNGLRDYPEL